MPPRRLLPCTTPAAADMSARAIDALLDRLDEKAIECHSLMIVRRGQVVAEAWWAPYSAASPQLLYSLTKSFTSIAVGLAVDAGLLAPGDRVVDVLPDNVPHDVSAQARRLTVHHLLSMTAGHATDTLAEAWQLEPRDLVKGFLRMPFTAPEGTLHTYDNATTFVLARMVERVSGTSLPDFLADRLFAPMGIVDVEWDRVASGAAFGFHGLHLTTEAVAAFGELLRCGGRWGNAQLVSREWVESATTRQVASRHYAEGAHGADFEAGYGYQLWLSRHGFHGSGAFGQHCVVVPSAELVVVVTSAQRTVEQAQDVLDAIWDCLIPGIGDPGTARDDERVAARLGGLALPLVQGEAGPRHPFTATIDASAAGSALPDGMSVTLAPAAFGGWRVRLGELVEFEVGHGEWREGSPLGRPVHASGGWQEGVFVAEVYVSRSPHSVRLAIETDAGRATAVWTTVPLTTADLLLHLRAPLMTRPDVA